MKWLSWLLIFAIPVLNIAFNTLAQRAARSGDGFWRLVTSPSFAAAFVVGCLSLSALIALYRQGISLPRGILFMGAASIIGGSLWGIWYAKVVPSALEIFLLIAISLLLVARLFQLSAPQT
jgi:hypothetical protein